MKPFDIELAKKGDKVCTRCGFIAIYDSTCKDKSYKFTIYDKYMNFIMFHNYAANGKFITIFDNGESEFDLFMTDNSDFQPKDEKPVYYKWEQRRAEEIIKELEKRGGKRSPDNCDDDEEDLICFINQFGHIDWKHFSNVKDSLSNFTELHLPPEKSKKEKWANLFYDNSSNCYWVGKLYDSESEAINAGFKTADRLKFIKTFKQEWEDAINETI